MWDAPDFRVLYDLKVLPIFDHAHPLIIKLTLAFLNFYQHAKTSAHFINLLSWETVGSEFHDLKDHSDFWPQPTKSRHFNLIH